MCAEDDPYEIYDPLPEWQILEGNESLDQKTQLVICSQEFADPLPAALFLQAFLQRFRPTESLVLTYAQTCDKMRSGAFDGGGFAIRADRVVQLNASECLEALNQEESPADRAG